MSLADALAAKRKLPFKAIEPEVDEFADLDGSTPQVMEESEASQGIDVGAIIKKLRFFASKLDK